MKIKIASVLLMVSGILLFLYPTLVEMVHNHQQQKLVTEWQNSMNHIHNGEDSAAGNMRKWTSVNNKSKRDAEQNIADEPGTAEQLSSSLDASSHAEGILTIEKIDLLLPILHGVTDENMKTTVASIENAGTAGGIGNYAIAGHRNRTYGRNFNRLDEVGKGDKIQVNNGEQLFEYTVTEKLYVKPEEVWVLNPNGTDKEITLITCHPMVNPTHRIIVKGKIVYK